MTLLLNDIGGIELVGEDLYNVNFDLITLSKYCHDEEDVHTYKWYNPRHLDGDAQGQGFKQEEIDELIVGIKEKGLLYPLVCRWVPGEQIIQVVDGERRFRCIRELMSNNELVWSRQNETWLPASEVYRKINCKLMTGDDKEVLRVAFVVSDRSIGWGDAATAKLIRRLRDCHCDDTEILDITKKSPQWLRDQDRICRLDDLTFNYLATGKINRALALKLADIDELSKRQSRLLAAYEDAVAINADVIEKAEHDLLKAEEKEEVADAELHEVMHRGKDSTTAQDKLDKAKQNTEKKRKTRNASATPRAKTSNLRRIVQKIADEGGELGDEDSLPLRKAKIQNHLTAIQDLIKNEGKDSDAKPIANLDVLRGCEACVKAILNGEDDIIKALRRHRAAMIIYQKRLTQQHPPEGSEEEE